MDAPQGASFLRTGIELGREVSRDSGNQVIFVEGGDSFLLRRRPYDKTFKKNQYSPDPSEPSRGWPGWKSLVESLQDKAVGRLTNGLQGRWASTEGFFQPQEPRPLRRVRPAPLQSRARMTEAAKLRRPPHIRKAPRQVLPRSL